MDTDSIRIWICFALGFGLAELFLNRLVFISAALGCLLAPVIVSVMTFKGGASLSPYIIAASIAVVTYILLALWLWRVREPKKPATVQAGPIGVRFNLGPTIPGKLGPDFILRIGRRVYVVEAAGLNLKAGQEVEITAIAEDTVTVKHVNPEDGAVESPFGGRFRSMALPDPPADEPAPVEEPVIEEEPAAPVVQVVAEDEETHLAVSAPEPEDDADELAPLLNEIEKAVGVEEEEEEEEEERGPANNPN